MGYRSEVELYIKEDDKVKEKYGSLEEIIIGAQLIEDFLKYDEDTYTIGHDSDNVRVLKCKFDWVKWYDTYDFIQYWTDIMNYLTNNDDEEAFLFSRLGEEPGDFETLGYLGDSWVSNFMDVDIDFSTREDDVIYKKRELYKAISESGLDNIITGTIYYRNDEELPERFKEENGFEKYINNSK